MTTFDDRERAQEAKFAHDAELNFKAEARRSRLLGEWAAGLLGKKGDDARAYALTSSARISMSRATRMCSASCTMILPISPIPR